jgi:hypothetical protein
MGRRVRIPLEARISARVFTVSVLSCVGSRIATGLTACPTSAGGGKIQSSRVILTENRPEKCNERKGEEKQEQDDEEERSELADTESVTISKGKGATLRQYRPHLLWRLIRWVGWSWTKVD